MKQGRDEISQIKLQVRLADQALFVGSPVKSVGDPPAKFKQTVQREPRDSRGQDGCACVRAQQRQKNEDMTRGQDRTKVYVVVMKGKPSAQGQTMKANLIVKTLKSK